MGSIYIKFVALKKMCCLYAMPPTANFTIEISLSNCC